MFPRPALTLLAVPIAFGACAPATRAPDTDELSVLTLSAEPTLEIGVMEGDENYTFQDVVSVARIAGGEVVVADGGISSVGVYAPDGTFLRRIGRRGEGPGEFQALSRVYPMGEDSLGGLDTWTRTVAVFDTAGAYARNVPVDSMAVDATFPLDVWLHGRFWVDGQLGTERRASVNAALDRLPSPRSGPGYRYVRVATDGRLWIREPGLSASGTRTWTVATADGSPEATVGVPARFEPQWIGRDELLGRWLGENDVNFVRAYALETGSGTRPAPAWLTEDVPATTAAEAPDDQAFLTAIRGNLRALASAQEIHYSTHNTYTDQIDSLSAWEPSGDVVVDIVFAGTRGWEGVFTDPAFDRMCALAYGYTIPAGWNPGEVTCSPAPSPAGAEH